MIFRPLNPGCLTDPKARILETQVDSPAPTFTDAVRYRISYAKTGPARVFGHLELANIMFRAFRRAKIPVAFSAGFHPKPKISFDDPLPLGMESLHETCVVSARPVFSTRQMMERLNQALPEGLAVTRWEIVSSKKEAPVQGSIRYKIQLKTGGFEKSRLEAFLASETFVINRINRKGITAKIDYKEHVEHLEPEGDDCLVLAIRSGHQQTLRPSEILAAIFDLPEEAIKTARVVKLAPA